ncbi:uncharacterized protein LOC119583110 [Penaeus monodon]|uniref:uncharacterized protein LOC119583110 n=1 Tax=Penaeus monodon TaxID=6687 RepID=UPI0018A6FB26|nr:uncharacterized protein LOC119583110 [Penaeus monodon]
MELPSATIITMLVVCVLLTMVAAVCLCLLFCQKARLQTRKEEVPISCSLSSSSEKTAGTSVRLLGINAPLTPTPTPPPAPTITRRTTATPWKLRLLDVFPTKSSVIEETALEEVVVLHTRTQNLRFQKMAFKDSVVKSQDGTTECAPVGLHHRPDFSRMFGTASHSIPSLIFDPSGMTLNQSIADVHKQNNAPGTSGEKSPSVLSSFLPVWSTTVLSSTSVVVSSTPVKV